MAKAELKTKATEVSVADFIAAVPDARRREEAAVVDAIHRRVTGHEPKMWGPSIIGYGSYDYVYESGRSGTFCRAGFSPRKAAMTIYLMGRYCDRQKDADALFARLGKHRTGKSCLYINKLADVDLDVLEQLVALSWDAMNERYPD
ncbi:DUF1801 domain-containing protein [Sphingopyxis alaskensis]|jgi:hypothetical protein|uniref:YdhG-like domain-containing protein n=1 Tax=Sphingopyxis alaskensis (strain DSM 13593 / LMG 18877 / RB2256) TaxID=317655 RepID=Q1GVV8_SPHAL|nr:DUF1801 domain-containing protein [Sphingopyxis alaskensis]ABF52214.1 conserved hypothetical protein [Sphingopyxis alaskensis RB2256]MCM3420003.1 DUF1801 domain-containing protein [Sphingopyxis alaskensis]